jgi:hypothetical protein
MLIRRVRQAFAWRFLFGNSSQRHNSRTWMYAASKPTNRRVQYFKTNNSLFCRMRTYPNCISDGGALTPE